MLLGSVKKVADIGITDDAPADFGFQCSIRPRLSLMLPEVLRPRCYEEYLPISILAAYVPRHFPTGRTITATHAAVAVNEHFKTF